MKKIFMLAILLILCTGCTRIDNVSDLSIIIDEVNSTSKTPNEASIGYKYYLPFGVAKVYDKDYNQKFKIDNEYVYLYVDIVSYHYKNSLNLNDSSISNYYYKNITNGDKTGYLKITYLEDKDLYYIKLVYNYAKIESYVPKVKIDNILANSMIILNSIDYNDILIEKILDEEYVSGADKEYKINKPKDAQSKFSEYLSEYVQDEENKIPDLPEY